MQLRTSAVIWRVLLSNPWSLRGSLATVKEDGVKRLRTHQLAWYEAENIPHGRRLGDFTVVMLGESRGCELNDDSYAHPGTTMKTKAAETGILFRWALDIIQDDQLASQVAYRSNLLIAGRSMQEWLELTRTGELCLTILEYQKLRDSAQRHLVHSRIARIALVPKHHFFAHLSIRAFFHGNPKAYTCFVDESGEILQAVATGPSKQTESSRI